MSTSTVILAASLLAGAIACGRGTSPYTLYRNGVGSDTLRIHIATFDADGDPEYNHDNCEQARELFQLHPAAHSRFWCEKGRFRKK